MPLSAIKSRYLKHEHARLCQGDILRDVTLPEPFIAEGDNIEVADRTLPFLVVLTQDCDLEQDDHARTDPQTKDNDKYLQSVLLCPAYQSLKVREGTHLAELKLQMQKFGSDQWKTLLANNLYRYHRLPDATEFQLPEVVLDFKQYFTAPRQLFYTRFKSQYVVSLGPLFREHLSQRFAQYLSRIGLPEFSEGAKPAAVVG